MPLTPGQLLNNRYRIVKLLGQGGFGAVYRAWDTNLNAPVAFKESFDTSPDAQKQFQLEAQLLFQLVHPNLPRVHDYFVIPGQGTYLVMDFVDGRDLQALLDERGPLPEAEVLPWIGQVCDALAYMHAQNPPVIHRDLKPANIKITSQGKAMLVDFGIAKIFNATQQTTLGARAVTPGFSPIEQYGSGGRTDARTDVYALGATLYTLLTGRMPPEAPERNAGGPLTAPRALNPAISPSTSAAILHALEMLPDRRFQSIGEFCSALRSPPAVQPIAIVAPVPATQVMPFSYEAAAPPIAASPPAAPRRFPWAWVIGVSAVTLICLLALLCKGLSQLAVTAGATATATQDASSILNTQVANTLNAQAAIEASQTAEAAAAATQAATLIPPTLPPPTLPPSVPPTVGAQVLYSEDFSNPTSSWATGPTSNDYGTTDLEFLNGGYQWVLKAKQGINHHEALNLSIVLPDTSFEYSATTLLVSGPPEARSGLVFRFQDDNNFYFFGLEQDGYYSLFAYQAGAWVTIQNWTATKDLWLISKDYNLLSVKGNGNTYQLYLNNRLQAALNANYFHGGKIGLAAELINAGDNATFFFDNLIVCTPDCSAH